MKSGQLQFSHPSGTHDDSLWALALAVYASRPERPVYHPVVLTGYIVKPKISIANLGLEKKTWQGIPCRIRQAGFVWHAAPRNP